MSAETPLMMLFRRVHRAAGEVERLKLDLSRGDDFDYVFEAISNELHEMDPPDLLRRQRLKHLRCELRVILRLAFTPEERRCLSESLPSLEVILGEATARLRRTSTLDDVRSYEPALRTPATLYLLDEIFRAKARCLPSIRIREFEFLTEGWEIYVCNFEIDNRRSLASDKSLRSVHTKDEFLLWFLERKIGAERLNPRQFPRIARLLMMRLQLATGDYPTSTMQSANSTALTAGNTPEAN
jgi:hypothetical protein